ncbi:MAG: insulinase family protein [Mycoplasmatales bacterium]
MTTIEINELQEKIVKHQFANGLTAYIITMEHLTKMEASYQVSYGSIDQQYEVDGTLFDDPAGIAHYLEHLMFAHPNGDYLNFFSELGSSPNAYTTFDHTCYYVTAPDNYGQNLKLLLEMCQRLDINDEIVEKERGIITEEIEMYNARPAFKVQHEMFAQTLAENNYAVDIAGSVDSIKEINVETLARIFELFYAPNNCRLFVCSPLAAEDVIELIDSANQMKASNGQITRKVVDYKLFGQKEAIEHKLPIAELNQPLTMFSIKMRRAQTEYEKIAYEVCADIIQKHLFSEISLNYNQAIENGQIDDSFSIYNYQNGDINIFVGRILGDDVTALKSFVEEQLTSRLEPTIIKALVNGKIGEEIRVFGDAESSIDIISDLLLRGIEIPNYYQYLYTTPIDEFVEICTELLENYQLTFITAIGGTDV